MFQRPQLARNLVRRLTTNNSALQRATTLQPQVATRWHSCITTATQPQITLTTSNVISKRTYTQASDDVNDRIKKMVTAAPVVVFMKGNPEVPQCGFSKAVVQILRMHGVEFDAYNVLEDDSLRSGIKNFSDWPTIPQVYINSSFVGGCDIILQMHQNGDLVDELKTVGIRSALLDK